MIEKQQINKELNWEYDTLRGNINRMILTDDKQELKDMYEWAKRKIDNIYNFCEQRLRGKINE